MSGIQPGHLVTFVVATQAGRRSGAVVFISTNGSGNVTLDVRDRAGVRQTRLSGARPRAFNRHVRVAPVLALAPAQQRTVGRRRTRGAPGGAAWSRPGRPLRRWLHRRPTTAEFTTELVDFSFC